MRYYKLLFSIVILIIILGSCFCFANTSGIKGDLDNDGEITILDVRLLLQKYINSINSELAISDMDSDNEITILDVRLLLQYYINGKAPLVPIVTANDAVYKQKPSTSILNLPDGVNYAGYVNTVPSTEGGQRLNSLYPNSPLLPGKYYFYVITTENERFYSSVSNFCEFTISPIEVNPVVSISDYAFGSPKSSVSVTGLPDEVNYASYYNTENNTNNGIRWRSVTNDSQLAPGTYYFYIKTNETPGYETAISNVCEFHVTGEFIPEPEDLSVKILDDNTFGETLRTTIDTDSVKHIKSIPTTYKWYYLEDPENVESAVLIENASGDSYTIGQGLVGKYIYVEATMNVADLEVVRTDITDATNNVTATVAKSNITVTLGEIGEIEWGSNRPDISKKYSIEGNVVNPNATAYYSLDGYTQDNASRWSRMDTKRLIPGETYYCWIVVSEKEDSNSAVSNVVEFIVTGNPNIIDEETGIVNNTLLGIKTGDYPERTLSDAEANKMAIQYVFDYASKKNIRSIKFENKQYIVNQFTNPRSNIDIDLNGSTFIMYPNDRESTSVFRVENVENVKIHNGKIMGDLDKPNYQRHIFAQTDSKSGSPKFNEETGEVEYEKDASGEYIYRVDQNGELILDSNGNPQKIAVQFTTHQQGHGLYIMSSQNIEISDMEVFQCVGDCIYIGDEYNPNTGEFKYPTRPNAITITRCNLHDARRDGITVIAGENIEISNNEIHDINGLNGKSPQSVEEVKLGNPSQVAIDLEPNWGSYVGPSYDSGETVQIVAKVGANIQGQTTRPVNHETEMVVKDGGLWRVYRKAGAQAIKDIRIINNRMYNSRGANGWRYLYPYEHREKFANEGITAEQMLNIGVSISVHSGIKELTITGNELGDPINIATVCDDVLRNRRITPPNWTLYPLQRHWYTNEDIMTEMDATIENNTVIEPAEGIEITIQDGNTCVFW